LHESQSPWELQPAHDRAVVTGGGSGLGRAVALALAQAGVEVTVMGRREEPLQETVRLGEGLPGSIHAAPGSVRDEADLDRVFAAAEQRGGPVPLLVHAAAGAFLSRAERISPNGFRSVVDVGLAGAFLTLRRWALPLIDAGQPGVACNVGSALGAREVPGAAHSAAAKAGLEALTRSLAVEWGRYGLRVNVVAPGAVSTEGAEEGMWSDTAVRTRVQGAIPMQRFGTQDEIVAATTFLVSRQASYVTGATFVVDGGWGLRDWAFFAPGDGGVSPGVLACRPARPTPALLRVVPHLQARQGAGREDRSELERLLGDVQARQALEHAGEGDATLEP
jgi:NAD(P)-dependent dehydrogenase (short-subunit alcohol dehydrogenase family)